MLLICKRIFVIQFGRHIARFRSFGQAIDMFLFFVYYTILVCLNQPYSNYFILLTVILLNKHDISFFWLNKKTSDILLIL